MCDEHEIRIPFFLCVSADQHFLFRFQIIRTSDFTSVLLRYEFLDLIETYCRDIFCLRDFNPEYPDLIRILFLKKFHRILEISGLHRHHILKPVDVSHLKVKACIFVQMTFCIMFLRTEYRGCLKYSVKYPDHHLFVELGALLQDRRPVEILQTEQVCTALSTLGADLRRVDLCKSLSVKEIAESSYKSFLNPESCSLP